MKEGGGEEQFRETDCVSSTFDLRKNRKGGGGERKGPILQERFWGFKGTGMNRGGGERRETSISFERKR